MTSTSKNYIDYLNSDEYYNRFTNPDPNDEHVKIVNHNLAKFDLTEKDVYLRTINPKNKYITPDYINSMFKRVGFDYKVSKDHENFNLYQIAMIHRSYSHTCLTDYKLIKDMKECEPIDQSLCKESIPLQLHTYERLEFRGDTIIHYALTKYLLDRFPNDDEGFISILRSDLECKKALSKYSKKLKMHKYAVISHKLDAENARINNMDVTEDIFEAFVGALEYDIGIQRASDFVINVIETLEDIPDLIRTTKNYKTELNRVFSSFGPNEERHYLEYVTKEIESKNGNTLYHSRVYDKNLDKCIGEGKASNKKHSQQRAAKNALLQLGAIGNDIDEEIVEIDFDINEISSDDIDSNSDSNDYSYIDSDIDSDMEEYSDTT